MRTECVTKLWEFYRDNCDGFKEPMRKEMRKLDDYVVSIEADNAKLREERDHWHVEQVHAYGNWEDAYKRATELESENAKLRELAEKAWKSAERLCQAFDGPCRDDGVTIDKPCPMGERDEECVYGLLQRDLRDLGVGVDE